MCGQIEAEERSSRTGFSCQDAELATGDIGMPEVDERLLLDLRERGVERREI
jgi:hypothetical protein